MHHLRVYYCHDASGERYRYDRGVLPPERDREDVKAAHDCGPKDRGLASNEQCVNDNSAEGSPGGTSSADCPGQDSDYEGRDENHVLSTDGN